IKPEKGVLVYGVYRDSPALEVGLKQGDILTHVNEEEIKNEKHYKELIAQSKPGQILTIKGYSQGQPFEKQIQTVERLPEIR
ncbi:MAG: PDZ domain-containing protein, partial [Xanthomonadales bacterium]|nr:PDZ domain-containing protein [Xanthomonadales bacterium]